MFCNGGSPSAMTNGACSVNQSNRLANDANILAGSIDVLPSLLSTQNSHMRRPNGINGTAIKSEPNYSDNSEFAFCSDSSFLEARPPIGAEHVASFSNSEMNGQPMNESLLDIDSSAHGFLSQMLRNFSFPDLTDDFAQSAGMPLSFHINHIYPQGISIYDWKLYTWYSVNSLFFYCLDILENYGRSPFLGTEANNFSDSPGRDCKGLPSFLF